MSRVLALVLLLVCWGGICAAGPPDGGDGGPPDAGPAPDASVSPVVPLAPVIDEGPKPRRRGGTRALLEAQNHCQAIATRYAQLLLAGQVDAAVMMHDFPGGRRPDIAPLRAACAERGPPALLARLPIVQTWAEVTTYYFAAKYPDGPELPLRVSVDHAGHIAGAAVGPQAEIRARLQRYDRYDQYQTRSTLSLPFRGEWTASSASPGAGNGHYLNANQRFAIDWLIFGDGKTYKNRGKDNNDYLAYGQEVLAPAAGTVVEAVDGVPDNLPGQVDVYFRLGNVVVLSLGNGEFAYLCHLQMGSVQVKPGDRVQRGQVLARCGNSGNSTEPHLHFQLGDGPIISRAASLPAQFRQVRKNGALLDRVQPQDGDRLSPQ